MISLLVTTRMSEYCLKKLLPWLQNSDINTQVKDHLPLKTTKT